MAKQRSDKSPYQSRFGAGWISESQFLAENMCSRKARAEFGGELPAKFWQDPYWEKQLRLQLKHANDLLKEYSVTSILAALKHPDAKKVYSLGLKNVLLPLIQKAQNKQNLIKNQETKPITVDIVDVKQTPRKPFVPKNKKNNLQSLRDLDNA